MSDVATPGYWPHETSGVLRPVIIAYLNGEDLTPGQCATMQAYLRQWIEPSVWHGETVTWLRDALDGLTSRRAIEVWLARALAIGIDPL